MPRHARFRLDGYPLHVIQRGNNRSACFLDDRDRILYLALMEELSRAHACHVHAYVLMGNHVHLLLTPELASNISGMMKDLGQRYAQHFNRTYKRTGSLWEGRFRSSIIDTEAYLLRCHRYIELNPVRAGMVKHPSGYVWSSYRVNAEGGHSTLVDPHPHYLALGDDAASRRRAYLELFVEHPPQREIDEIRAACRGGFALGRDAFIAELERVMGRSVVRSPKGSNGKNLILRQEK